MKNQSDSSNSRFNLLWLRRRRSLIQTAVVVAACAVAPSMNAFPVPKHYIVAANIDVVQLTTANNDTNAITITNSYSIGDFRMRDGSERGDYNVQMGDDFSDDYTNGVLIASVAQNGRDNGESGATRGTMYCASMILPAATGYRIDINVAGTNGAGNNPEFNINVAAAWFPFTNWLGGIAFPLSGANGSATVTNDTLLGSTQLVYGVNYIDQGAGGGTNAGRSIVSLLNLGYDSRTDGVLLVNGAKNESANYALSGVNTSDGTWNLYVRDTGNTANGEQDPVCFVFIPKTNTTVVSGRFRGDASIDVYSGTSPQFTVTQLGTGRYELKIPGFSPTNGVLIVSPESGGTASFTNFDNIVSYQINGAGDGWEIQSRDTPAVVSGTAIVPPVEAIPAAEAVCSFVFIPGAVPGFTVAPTNNLLTTEAGGTASFTVTLDSQPTDDVTIAVSSSNSAEGTNSPTSLTFTTNNWNVAQTVTIYGVDDAVQDGVVAYTIVLAAAVSTDPKYNNLNPPDVSVANADNEAGITVSPTSGLVTTEAGGTNTFTIVLNTQPSANVTIGLSSSDPTEGTVSPASVTFTSGNWNVPQTVTVTGVDDLVDDGNVAYTIVTAAASSGDSGYNGLNASDVSVSNTDDDTAGFTVSAYPAGLQVVEGGTNSFTVVLDTEPAANVTVNFTSTDTAQGGTASPSSVTFTPANWNTPQTVNVIGANDLVADSNTGWIMTNSISSSDATYAALSPIIFSVTTLDNEARLALPSGELIYGIGQPGVGIDGRASITDPNTPNYSGGTLTVSLTANGTADDRLEIRNTGTGAGQIGVSGTNVSYGGTTIGSFSGGVGTSPLVVTFNSSASPAAAQGAFRNVTFRNVSSSPSLNKRTASVTLAETTGYSTNATTSIRVGLLRFSDFQEGADHGYGLYSGEADCHLRQGDPNTAYPAGSGGGLFIDFDAGQVNFQTLLRFDSIYGTNFGQVPTNAVIVSADLLLRIPPEDANSMGDGSPLYRMLGAWDEANVTWASFGSDGIQTDDNEARSTFDSAFGTAGGGGNSGTGTISFSVRPDVLAWQGGVANYGWVMPGWVGNTDGTTISPGEAATISDRPRLRVLWVPAGSATEASFRQNVNGYTNAHDTRIRQNEPDTEVSTAANVFVDWDTSNTAIEAQDQVLIRFDDILGSGTNQIPSGSQIHAAVVDVASIVNNAQGDGGQFFAMLSPWQDTNTWNSMTNGIQTDGIEAASTATAAVGSAALSPQVQGGYNTFELTPDVQAWASGTRANYGWAILPWPSGQDGWAISTSESSAEQDRPRLRVYYTPPIVITSITRGPTSATIQFSGPASTSCTVFRSATVSGTYGNIGSTSTLADGTASFTDNSPLPGAAFYRISTP